MPRRKKYLVLYFLGIDGSGKSTLSNYLYQQLKARGFNVTYTWWLESENSLFRRLLRKIGDKRAQRQDAVQYARSINPGHPYSGIYRVLYPRFVLLDYLRFGIAKTWQARIFGKDRIIIFDRFFPDVVIALSKEFEWSSDGQLRWMTLFKALLPKPDLTLMIDVSPEVAYQRKIEEIQILDNSVRSWHEYNGLRVYLENTASFQIVNVNNNGDISTAENEVLNPVLRLIERNKIKCLEN